MRVWLVDDRRGENGESLEVLLRQLQARPETELRLVGAWPMQPDFAAAVRKQVPDLLDVVVVNEAACPEERAILEVLSLGVGVVLVTSPEQVGRFQALAEEHPLWFVPSLPSLEALWLALVGAVAGQRRLAFWKGQVDRLQQRLRDRITIERAKGILVEMLGITEEDAYQRMRLLSRQQRCQIRDIAQSLLNTPFPSLVKMGVNGAGKRPEAGKGARGEGREGGGQESSSAEDTLPMAGAQEAEEASPPSAICNPHLKNPQNQ